MRSSENADVGFAQWQEEQDVCAVEIRIRRIFLNAF